MANIYKNHMSGNKANARCAKPLQRNLHYLEKFKKSKPMYRYKVYE